MSVFSLTTYGDDFDSGTFVAGLHVNEIHLSAMADKWLVDYDASARLGHEIMEAITDRNRQPRDSTMYTKKSAAIRTLLLQFGRDVSKLGESLGQSALMRRITEREVERRQLMVDQLVTTQKRLDMLFTNNDQRSIQRTALLGNTNPFADDPWGEGGSTVGFQDGARTSAPDDNLTVDQIRQQQQQLIREQDQGLDALSRVIGRQKQIALDIGNEVDVHNEIIDDINEHVDSTNTRLIRETHHVRVVDRKASGACWMYVVIVLLLIAIIVIACIPFNK